MSQCSLLVQLLLWVSYSSSCQFYLGNLIMSPTWQISLGLLSIKLKDSLGHICVVLNVQGFIPASDFYPDSIIPYLILLMSTFLYPVPSHSCGPLEDLLPSSSQYGFSSALPEDEDLEFWWWYIRIHFHHWWTPLLQLSIFTYLIDNLLNPLHVLFQHIYSHGLDYTGSFGFWRRP